MSEVINLKTDKTEYVNISKQDAAINTIEFLEIMIKELKQKKLDPEKCIVLAKWKSKKDYEQIRYWHNGINTETFLSLLELNKDMFLKDIKKYD